MEQEHALWVEKYRPKSFKDVKGQLEIIEDKVSGFLWNSTEQLKEFTKNLTSDSNLREKISQKAISQSQEFSKEKFAEKIKEIVN